MKVAVVGTGYVGLVVGACLAETGNDVVCADLDAAKIASLKRSQLPIYEPGLEPLVVRNRREGRLEFTTDVGAAIERSEDEVRKVRGVDAEGKFAEVTIAPGGTPVANPAFDVTPAELVTGLVTEKGVVRATEAELLKFWPRTEENKAYLT